MLGPGIMVGSTPLALGYSLYARTRTTNRPLMYAALGLAGFATLFLAYGIVQLVVDFIRH